MFWRIDFYLSAGRPELLLDPAAPERTAAHATRRAMAYAAFNLPRLGHRSAKQARSVAATPGLADQGGRRSPPSLRLPSLLGRVMRARERLPAPGRPVARSRRRRARSTPQPSYIAHRTARAARTTSHASYPASSYFVHLTSYIVAHLKILFRIFTPCLARGASFTQHPLVTL